MHEHIHTHTRNLQVTLSFSLALVLSVFFSLLHVIFRCGALGSGLQVLVWNVNSQLLLDFTVCVSFFFSSAGILQIFGA